MQSYSTGPGDEEAQNMTLVPVTQRHNLAQPTWLRSEEPYATPTTANSELDMLTHQHTASVYATGDAASALKNQSCMVGVYEREENQKQQGAVTQSWSQNCRTDEYEANEQQVPVTHAVNESGQDNEAYADMASASLSGLEIVDLAVVKTTTLSVGTHLARPQQAVHTVTDSQQKPGWEGADQSSTTRYS